MEIKTQKKNEKHKEWTRLRMYILFLKLQLEPRTRAIKRTELFGSSVHFDSFVFVKGSFET